MNFITAVSIFYVAAFVLIFIIAAFKNVHLKVTQLYALTCGFILSLSIIAFFTKPYVEDDLVFYFQLLRDMRQNGLRWTLTESIYASDIVINLYFYLIAQTGVYQLLPALSVAIIYSLLFASLYQVQSRYKTSLYPLLFFLAVHFSFLFFRWTLSGIRNYIAFSLFAYAVIREFVLKKQGPLNWVLYLTATFTHFSLAFFLLIRVLCSRFLYGYVRRWKYVLVGWGLVCGLAARVLTLVPIGFIQKIASKIQVYFLYMDFDMRKVVLRFLLFVMLLFMYSMVHKYNRQAIDDKKRYYAFLEITMLLILGAVFIPLLFDRSVSFLLFASFPLFADFFACSEKRSRYLSLSLLAAPSAVMAGIQLVDAYNYWSFFL